MDTLCYVVPTVIAPPSICLNSNSNVQDDTKQQLQLVTIPISQSDSMEFSMDAAWTPSNQIHRCDPRAGLILHPSCCFFWLLEKYQQGIEGGLLFRIMYVLVRGWRGLQGVVPVP